MSTENIVLIIFMVLILVLIPVFTFRRNKKEQEKQQNLISSLKKDDYILTYSGIFGKIVEIVEKEMGKFVVIETGEAKKSYATVSENAIYMVTNNNPKVYDSEGNVIAPSTSEELAAEEVEEKTEEKEEKKKQRKEEKKNNN